MLTTLIIGKRPAVLSVFFSFLFARLLLVDNGHSGLNVPLFFSPVTACMIAHNTFSSSSSSSSSSFFARVRSVSFFFCFFSFVLRFSLFLFFALFSRSIAHIAFLFIGRPVSRQASLFVKRTEISLVEDLTPNDKQKKGNDQERYTRDFSRRVDMTNKTVDLFNIDLFRCRCAKPTDAAARARSVSLSFVFTSIDNLKHVEFFTSSRLDLRRASSTNPLTMLIIA
jgi:hypothetical protein